MHHDTTLIATIVMGLVLAFVGGFVASKLRLPPLVGYLLAGVAVGPFTPGFVADEGLATQLAEIGVILLMFGVGLHFSIKDLLEVRRIAIPGAVGQIAVATAMGAGMAHFWGWSFGGGLVFGLALSVASTVVLLRALEERNVLQSPNGRIAVGWLIVEDLAMVLTLVLLPSFAGLMGEGDAAKASGSELAATIALTLGKVALFLAFVLVIGRRVVPWILEQVARTGSRELFTLSVLATALGIAFGSAELFGVSFALGAFFAGVILNESDFSHQAAADSLPLQDAFAVLFFVSVGMLFDPTILVREPLAVLAVVAVIVFGKSLAAFAIVLASGYPLSTALTVSASLAQIGEFSFILAGLGVTLGMLPEEGRDLILAGALLSITLNPLVFLSQERLSSWLRKHPRIISLFERKGADGLLTLSSENDSLSGHAIVVGHGRVGSIIASGLMAEGVSVIVIDHDRRRVEDLRARGVAAIYGDASTPGVLEAAHADKAKLLVISSAEGYRTRRTIEMARNVNPGIDTAVRTNSESEVAYLEKQGVGLAIMGERELAFGLMEYSMRSVGVSQYKSDTRIQKFRMSGDGGAFERQMQSGGIPATPELRQRSANEGD